MLQYETSIYSPKPRVKKTFQACSIFTLYYFLKLTKLHVLCLEMNNFVCFSVLYTLACISVLQVNCVLFCILKVLTISMKN